MDVSELRPFLFGKAACENWDNNAEEKRLNQNESRLFISELDIDFVRATVKTFPYFLKFEDNPEDDRCKARVGTVNNCKKKFHFAIDGSR